MRRVLRLTLVALVVAVLAMVSWPLVSRTLDARATAHTQQDLRSELAAVAPQRASAAARERVEPVIAPVGIGEPIGELRIPRFGGDWSWVLSEGVTDDVLAGGPGRYPDTARVGDVGNVGIAAHRAGHGDPFIDFDLLQVGDRVTITRGRTTWAYRLTTTPEIVPVTATWVLAPEQGRELTLTTCWPKYGSAKRMYVRAVLDDVTVADRG